MANDHLPVRLAQDGFYPQAMRWQGRWLRVLAVEDVHTRGAERRFRVRTPEGTCDLGYHTRAGTWQMRRAPTWLQRIWANVLRMPRYPLPARRRRGAHTLSSQPAITQPRPAAAPRLAPLSPG